MLGSNSPVESALGKIKIWIMRGKYAMLSHFLVAVFNLTVRNSNLGLIKWKRIMEKMHNTSHKKLG